MPPAPPPEPRKEDNEPRPTSSPSIAHFLFDLPDVLPGELHSFSSECPIGSNPYEIPPLTKLDRETAVKLPCGHIFGQNCLSTWFHNFKSSCPMCRRDAISWSTFFNVTCERVPVVSQEEWMLDMKHLFRRLDERERSDVLAAVNDRMRMRMAQEAVAATAAAAEREGGGEGEGMGSVAR